MAWTWIWSTRRFWLHSCWSLGWIAFRSCPSSSWDRMSLTSYRTLCANSSRARWAVERKRPGNWFGLYGLDTPKNDWAVTVAQREETISLFSLGVSVSVYLTVSSTPSHWPACELNEELYWEKTQQSTRSLFLEPVPIISVLFGQIEASWCSGLCLYPSGPQHMCLQCQGFGIIVNLTQRGNAWKDYPSGSARFCGISKCILSPMTLSSSSRRFTNLYKVVLWILFIQGWRD